MSNNTYLQWISRETQSIYWHDSAINTEKSLAFQNGAVGMTTNPFLVNATLRNDKAFWEDRLAKLPKNLKGDEKVEALMRVVTGFYAEQTRNDFQKGIPGTGYVCAQTNPNRTGEAEYMFDQAKRLASWSPNIVIKLPATRAGIEAYEECAAIGLNVAATVSFSVSQVVAVGEARERGKIRALANGLKPGLGIAVLMVGRLDDYMRDVAKDQKSNVTEKEIPHAGTACIKHAYSIFKERNYDTYLMPAGCRGANHIIDLAGGKMILSIAPKIAVLLKDYDKFEERIDMPVEKEILNKLLGISEYRRAYEPYGMKPEEFITFGATNRTTDQFINDGWNMLTTYEY